MTRIQHNRYSSHRVSRRTWLRSVAALGLVGLGSSVYASTVEPNWIEIEHLSLPLSRLDPVFAGYRIVHLSDIHIDSTWMVYDRLAGIVDRVNAQQPDLVVFTGDFVTGPLHPMVATTFSTLGRVQARDGILAVLGNHDHWTNPEFVRSLLRIQGIIELRDAIHTIRRNTALLHIVGMDDLWPTPEALMPVRFHQPRLDELVMRLPATGAAVLLVHEPDFADITSMTGRFDLQLSGHSHGGQIRVPFSGAPVIPPLAEIYPAGLYQIGDLLHYTNRGVGMIAPQVRINCRPEITVITLKTL